MPRVDGTMILWVLLGIGAVLWVVASLTGRPEVFSCGMAAVLGLSGAVMGVANWFILIRYWCTRQRESLIPLLGSLFICLAARWSGFKSLMWLMIVLDPWPLSMLIGLLLLPFRLLRKPIGKHQSQETDAGK